MMNPAYTSSFSGSDNNQQIKYQRALKEIKKVVNANKILKQQNQETRIQLQQRISELTQKLNDTKERYQRQHKERLKLEKYIEQLQDSNSVIRKEHQASEKELLYLNEMIAEQTEQLKKLSIFKNQKKIGNIIKTYEEKEELSNNQKIVLHNKVKDLQQKMIQIYKETQQDRIAKEKAQQKYLILQKELESFRELYLATVQRHEKYIEEQKNSDKTRIKQKLLTQLIKQFKQQVQNLKQAQRQSNMTVISNKNYEKNFEVLIEDKTKISVELVNLKNQYQIAQERIEQSFVIQQKLREATAKVEQLTQQVNMLKSKVVILQTKDIINEDIQNEEYLSQVSHSKVIEEKISYLLAQADPLATIKNTDDSSHFKILSAYVSEMRDKLGKAYAQNKELSLKYKALASRRHRHESENTEYNVDFLIGKVQSYERLTEKLQHQLQKAIKMNDIYMRRGQQKQMKASQMRQNELQQEINIIKYQIQQTESRAGQAEKRVINEVYQLKKQLANKNILIEEKDSKIKELQNYIRIYEQKSELIKKESQRVDKENMRLHDQLMIIKQETMQLQLKFDSFLLQKQEFKRIIYEEGQNGQSVGGDLESGSKIHSLESRMKILTAQNQRLQRQYENISRQASTFKKELQQIKENQHFQVIKLQKQNQFYKDEQAYYSEAQRTIRELQKELQIARLRAARYPSDINRINQLEDQLSRKNDQISQLKRKLGSYEITYKELKDQRDRLQFDLRAIGKNIGDSHIVEQERRRAKIFQSELNNERTRSLLLQNELSSEKNLIFNLQSKIRQLQTQLQYAKSSNIKNTQQSRNWHDHHANQIKPSGVRISSSIQYAGQSESVQGDTYGRIVTTVPSRYNNQVDSWNYQIKGQPSLIQRESYQVKSVDSGEKSRNVSINMNTNPNQADHQIMRGLDSFQTRTITSVGFYEAPVSGNSSRVHNMSVQRASIDQENQQHQTGALSNQAIKAYPSFEAYKASFKFIKDDKPPIEQKRIY